MNISSKKNIELPRVRRQADSWDGIVIEYLMNHPSKKPVNELVMEAVTNYWLVEALVGTISEQELIKASWLVMGSLEGKLITIRTISGIPKLREKQVPTVEKSVSVAAKVVTQTEPSFVDEVVPNSNSTQVPVVVQENKPLLQNEDEQKGLQDEDFAEFEEEDLGLLQLPLSHDLKIANDLMGFNQSN
ncbi:hypothetical protein Ava_B0041 (plasmid) [Trichormus variabilis ATCC 29413]|uniref:Uncharacterized protein n=2 Tax=Anabaena variabilis TaxID=264691 RepID=Q3M2N1_TRIV2|nr:MULTISPECIES: hypothetical protein [Nostocaceae]ABA24755.1 hypothetical protein Ava_B0041 [Trichormus variabilis ATCC 29413]MBC1218044.1 hypothetical protein [Trichormus variabilis ARAD]MBC1259330.1 hypothetical protein [Trichormus variabilis V5]MBC1270778.1 hypothetical protein [Trichormus variabilis FSR]MBC1305691.1 hypothetical protein [Trichormus variabilis N2B]